MGGEHYALPCAFCGKSIRLHLNGIATIPDHRCSHYSRITTIDAIDGKILVWFERK